MDYYGFIIGPRAVDNFMNTIAKAARQKNLFKKVLQIKSSKPSFRII